MSGQVGYLRPRWMILGVDMEPDGVTIWFSDTPTEASVEVMRREPDIFGFAEPFARSEIDHVNFTIKVQTYRWVKGATYEEALRRLFDSWTPTTERDPAVGPQPALPRPQEAVDGR